MFFESLVYLGRQNLGLFVKIVPAINTVKLEDEEKIPVTISSKVVHSTGLTSNYTSVQSDLSRTLSTKATSVVPVLRKWLQYPAVELYNSAH